MLKRIKPDSTLPCTLTVKSQGETIKFNVEFYNRTQDEIEAKVAEGKPHETMLFMVKSWETEYELTSEGVMQMESERPGLYIAIFQAFHDARRTEVVKN